MPSQSLAQARLMAAAAHTEGGYDGVPQSVGREFNTADQLTGILRSRGGKAVEGRTQRTRGRQIEAMSNSLRRFNRRG